MLEEKSSIDRPEIEMFNVSYNGPESLPAACKASFFPYAS